MHCDTLDQGGGHLHQPAKDRLDPAIPLLLLQLADGLGLSHQVVETEARWVQVLRKGLGGLEGRDHVEGGRLGGIHQVLQSRR